MRLFGRDKKQFAYQSDAQLAKALAAGQQAAFDFVFDRYHELLQSNIKSAFHIKENDKAERVFKKRCSELQDYLLADGGAKQKLYNVEDSDFMAWLASVSYSFFKKTFCDENTAIAERYRKGDDAIVYQRFKSDFEEKIKLSGKKGLDVIEENAKDLAYDLKLHLFDDNYRRLNTYDPSKKSFDTWFKTVLHNFFIDQYRKNQKKEEEVIDSGGFVRIDDETNQLWESSIMDTDDNEKKEFIQILRDLLDTLEPPRYREVLIALYFDGEKKEDVAQRYEVSMDNFYNITSRALARFKKMCIEHGINKR